MICLATKSQQRHFYLIKASMGDKLEGKSKSVPFPTAHTATPLLKLSLPAETEADHISFDHWLC